MAIAAACPFAQAGEILASAAAGESTRVTGDGRILNEDTAGVSLRLEEAAGHLSVEFNYTAKALDVSAFRDLAVRVKNGASAELDVVITGVSDLPAQLSHTVQGRFLVRPDEAGDLRALMTRPALPDNHPFVKRLGNLYAFPWGMQKHWQNVAAEAIRRVTVSLDWVNAEAGQTVVLTRPFGIGNYTTNPAALKTMKLPLVDTFGQTNGADWPGKVKQPQELREDAARDLALAARFTGPREGRDRFGGLADGPALKATGFFRVEKIDGVWWFVDPEGRLFWSQGVNGVGGASDTSTKGRQELFPAADRDAKRIAYYTKNLRLKDGEKGWQEKHVATTVARLFDWGMNTIGAWSSAEVINTRRVPYTLIVHVNTQGFGANRKIPDPYSDAFKDSLKANLSRLTADHAGSPWLLGVFIDNELEWMGNYDLVEAIMGSPEKTPARRALVAFLDERYGGIEALNAAWKTKFKTIAAIAPKAGKSGGEAYAKDLLDFLGQFAATYFRECREAMNTYLPNHLYLGCRFNTSNAAVSEAASRYCDVISANVYRYQVADFTIKTTEDRPYLISEFHFGVRDYGVWGVGLTGAANARNQADLYRAYLSDALANPNVIGTHWFMWSDNIATGRSDGENYGVGLVTVVDRPNETLVNAIRNVSDKLYDYRLHPRPGLLDAPAEKP